MSIAIGDESFVEAVPEIDWIAKEAAESSTAIKIKTLCIAIFGGFCSSGACGCLVLTFSAHPIFIVPTVALSAIFGTLYWYRRTHLVDFSTFFEVGLLRDWVKTTSLKLLMERYTLAKVFAYALVNPKRFQEIYNEHVAGMSVSEIIKFYEEARKIQASVRVQESYVPMEIPLPKLWKAKLFAETNQLDYKTLMRRNDFGKLIRYEMITPKDLERSFLKFTDGLSFAQSSEHFEQLKQKLAPFPEFALSIPENRKAKFQIETAEMNVGAIISNYDLDSLLKGKILSQEEYGLLNEGKTALNLYQSNKNSLDGELENKEKEFLEQCGDAQRAAGESFDAHPAHNLLQGISDLEKEKLQDVRKSADDQIEQIEKFNRSLFEQSYSHLSSESHLEKGDLEKALERLRKDYWDRTSTECRDVRNGALAQEKESKKEFEGVRKPHLDALFKAEQLLDETCSHAEERYQINIKTARAEAGKQSEELKAGLDKSLSQIEERYSVFRAVTPK